MELAPEPTVYDKYIAMVMIAACFALGIFALIK
jgi:hypothetical protein